MRREIPKFEIIIPKVIEIFSVPQTEHWRLAEKYMIPNTIEDFLGKAIVEFEKDMPNELFYQLSLCLKHFIGALMDTQTTFKMNAAVESCLSLLVSQGILVEYGGSWRWVEQEEAPASEPTYKPFILGSWRAKK